MNFYQLHQRPYVFAVDYGKSKGICIPFDEIDKRQINFSINEIQVKKYNKTIELQSNPIDFLDFKIPFNSIQKEIFNGNSYLTNLTFRTEIDTNYSLAEIFEYSTAKYKLWIKDSFTLFSPERFILIKDGIISTNPMKGTVMADIPNAEQLIKSNLKERYEHNTIVDLLRNDLSMVANQVKLERFQYLEKIRTHNNDLIQMSSEISGKIKSEYQNQFGSLLDLLLPAGSICGAPKQKTVEIIDNYEDNDRGYYTGVFGTYEPEKFECAVMIRFIEQIKDKLFFRSGGGITALSDAAEEYEEMKNKIYVPIF